MEVDGVKQGSPAPKFSGTPTSISHGPRPPGCDNLSILQELGYSSEAIEQLITEGVVV